MITTRNQRQEAAGLVKAVNENKKEIETQSWKQKVTHVPSGVEQWFDENCAAYERKIQHVRRIECVIFT